MRALRPLRLSRMHSSYRTVLPLAPSGISVPIQNPFNPFTVADATLHRHTLCRIPVTTGVSYRAINDAPLRTIKTTLHDMLFDIGLRGEMGEFGDYFKTWNWELGFRYSRNEQENLLGGVVSKSGCAKRCWIPIRLRRLIRSWASSAATARPRSAESMLLCTVPAPLNCLWAISILTAICSIFRRGQSPSRSGLNTAARGGGTIPIHSIHLLTRLAPRILKPKDKPGRLGNVSGSAISCDQPSVEVSRRV